MLDLILHHYPASPFSEKIRLVMGFKGLTWRSVTIPAIMPKPNVIALTGGHRRTPILQIGADVYCDTALICLVLETVAPSPSLYPFGDTLELEAMSRFAEHVMVGIRSPISAMSNEDLGRFFPDADAKWLEAYRSDRMAMRKCGGGSQAIHNAMRAYLVPRHEAQFRDGRLFLLGNSPCVADFAVYHTYWVIAQISVLSEELGQFPSVLKWVARMRAFGHGDCKEISSMEAIEVAKASVPEAMANATAFETSSIALGDIVDVLPADGGSDTVSGELVDCSVDRIAVRRVDAQAGVVIVHFPRTKYRVRHSG